MEPASFHRGLVSFPVKIPIDESESSCFRTASRLVKAIRPDFSDELDYQFFTEGYTNRVLSIWCRRKGSDDRVLVRIFGEKTELLIDRDAELKNLVKLNSIGCGARVYGTFLNGLLYEFLPGEALDCEKLADRQYYRLIARNLAKLHTSLPFTKDEESIQPFFVRKIQSFLMELKDFSFEDNQKQKFFVQHFGNCEVLHDQMQQLVAAIGRLNSPLVFCHNDLLPKNIVYNSALSNQVKKTLHAYDIADHFCEFAGMENFDPDRYPSKEIQLDWLKEYLTAFGELSGEMLLEPTKEKVEDLYVAVNKCAAASDFFWGIWGIIQAKHSSIDFDYLQFAAQRLEQFKKRSSFTSS